MANTYTTIQGDTLYIPLCFYSNRIGERYPSLIAFFTFHYVSILIWQSLRYLSKWGTFTFHYFNYDLHFFFRSAHVIYIPLCLYFNLGTSLFGSPWAAFTFHYVSILIVTSKLPDRKTSKFTFHYVSILITRRRYWRWLTLRVYIPLCLYFNPTSIASNSRRCCLHSIMSLF